MPITKERMQELIAAAAEFHETLGGLRREVLWLVSQLAEGQMEPDAVVHAIHESSAANTPSESAIRVFAEERARMTQTTSRNEYKRRWMAEQRAKAKGLPVVDPLPHRSVGRAAVLAAMRAEEAQAAAAAKAEAAAAAKPLTAEDQLAGALRELGLELAQ